MTPSLLGGKLKVIVELRFYNLCKYTRENEVLLNHNRGEI